MRALPLGIAAERSVHYFWDYFSFLSHIGVVLGFKKIKIWAKKNWEIGLRDVCAPAEAIYVVPIYDIFPYAYILCCRYLYICTNILPQIQKV